MVIEQYVGIKHHPGQVQVIGQLRQEPQAVSIAPEDHRAAVAAAGDMVNGIGEVNAWRTWHSDRPALANRGT